MNQCGDGHYPPSRRAVVMQLLGLGAAAMFPNASLGQAAPQRPRTDATFIFTSDVHACRMASGLNPDCANEGKTDASLLRHIAAINRISGESWPSRIDGAATRLAGAGHKIAEPLGVIIGGDMTDDGDGQVATPGEGSQLRQFSQRYQQGIGPDRIHFPVYTGLGNHDLDQDGPPPHVDWYRRELRDYVELNHRTTVFFKPPVPVLNYDVASDSYSWDWGGLHLVQAHRFAGDTTKGGISGLPWLKNDLTTYAADGRPVVLFQHYGWDQFSTERWDPVRRSFDETTGPARRTGGAMQSARRCSRFSRNTMSSRNRHGLSAQRIGSLQAESRVHRRLCRGACHGRLFGRGIRRSGRRRWRGEVY